MPTAHPEHMSAATPAGRLTREQSKANTRERLLDAARSVFARSGFHGASVEEIASRAGYSTGALYSNFDGKEDLFLVLMEREIEEHSREIGAAVSRRSSVAEPARGGGVDDDDRARAGPAAAVHGVLGLRRARPPGAPEGGRSLRAGA